MPTYNTVSVTGNNIFGNSNGEVVNVTFQPLSLYFDTVNNIEINAPTATATSNNAGLWTVSGLIDPTPGGTGMAWFLTVSDKLSGQILYSANVQIAFANGASQQWLALTPPPPPATTTTYLVTPGSQPGAAGQFLVSTAANSNNLSWTYGDNPLNCRNFGADPTGVADSTTAIQNAINAATGNANPVTNSRAAKNKVYLPAGSYKISADLLIQSVQGFHFYGDGPELTILVASGAGGWTNGPITVDGSYGSIYEGFTIKGDGTEQVNNAFTLTWTTGAQRSTTGNLIKDIRIRVLNFVYGLNMAGVGTRQVDGTKVSNVVVGGQQAGAGTWSNSGNWQQGIVIGSGSFGNIYDFVLDRVDANNCYYGYYVSASGMALYGAQPANNFCDFYINPGAQTTITNVQSQNSGQLLTSPSNFSPIPVSFNDIEFKTSYLGNSNTFITIAGGYWNFNNVTATNLQVSAAYVSGLISVVGSGAARLAVCLFRNLSLFGARTSAFTPITNAVLIVEGYTNYNPTTGNSTYVTGDAASQNVGGVWSNITGVTVPQVNFISATGNTSYTVPAGSQILDVTLVAGGSGGGSGAFATTGAAGGGSGGGGGGYSQARFASSTITAGSLTVTVGAGGNGGAAVTANGAGNPGQAGGSTLFGAYLWCHGGSAQAGGGNATNAATVAGGTGGVGMINGGTGGATVTTNAAPVAVTPGGVTCGGAAGGGVFAGPTANNGAGCAAVYLGSNSNSSSGGVVGGASPTSGTAPPQGDVSPGGGGGAASLSGAAQQGANAQANSGAGGGGGGATSGGTTSGAGGNGGNGWALIIAYFQ